MIRFQLLGAIDLRKGDGARVRSVLAQPRRLALLAYLTLRAPRGAERRDTLLPLFWPDSRDEQARGALRNALHFLRQALGSDAIVSAGSGDVHVAPTELWCDACEFERLLDAGRPAEALDHYRGDLMEGFFVEGAPQFERWLEAERERLRLRAMGAAHALAESRVEAGEPGAAESYARRALALDPFSDESLQALVRALIATGEFAGALRAVDAFVARMRSELEIEPAPETLALGDVIRRAIDEHPKGPPKVGGVDPVPAVAASSETEQRARTERRSSRRRLIGLGALAGAALLVAAAITANRSIGGMEPIVPTGSVAVFPLEYHGSPEFAHLSEGVASLLATGIHGANELVSVDPRAVSRSMRSISDPPDTETVRSLAAGLDADAFLTGQIIENTGRVRIDVTVHTLERARGAANASTRARIGAEGLVDDLLALVDQIVLQVLGDHAPTGLGRLAARTTHSVAALRPFLLGEAALLASRHVEALEWFREAVAADSTFALAQYRFSTVAWGLAIPGLPHDAALAAGRHSARLGSEDRLLVEGWLAHLEGRIFDADSLYRRTIWQRPSHAETRLQFAELIFHWGSVLGVPISESAREFRYALEIEPRHADAALHLARLAARDGDIDGLRGYMAIVTRDRPDHGTVVELDALLAFAGNDPAAERAAFDAIAANPARDLSYLQTLTAHGNDLEAASRLARHLLTFEGTPANAAGVRLQLVHILLARGRFAEADSVLRAGTAMPRARRLETRAMIATLPWIPVADEELRDLIRALESEPDIASAEPPSTAHPPHILWPTVWEPMRLYLLGSLHARLANHEEALDIAALLADDDDNSVSAHHAAVVRSRVALELGRPGEALEALGPRMPLHPMGAYDSFLDHARFFERYLRGESLRRIGRRAEALRWLATFPDPTGQDVIFVPASLLLRGEIHELDDDADRAAETYRRLLALWADADDVVEDVIDGVRKRLSLLSERSPPR